MNFLCCPVFGNKPKSCPFYLTFICIKILNFFCKKQREGRFWSALGNVRAWSGLHPNAGIRCSDQAQIKIYDFFFNFFSTEAEAVVSVVKVHPPNAGHNLKARESEILCSGMMAMTSGLPLTSPVEVRIPSGPRKMFQFIAGGKEVLPIKRLRYNLDYGLFSVYNGAFINDVMRPEL